MAARTLAVLLALLLFAALRAEGHSSDAKIVIEGTRARLQVTVHTHHLGQFDENSDGLLSAAEIERNFDQLNAWLDAKMSLVDQRGKKAHVTFADLIIPSDAKRSSTVTIVRTFEWDAAPTEVTVRLPFSAQPRKLTLRAEGWR